MIKSYSKKGNALKLHGRGRDESTLGPIFNMHQSEFYNVENDIRNKNKTAILLHGVQLYEMSGLAFKNSRSLKLHLIVGDSVIKLESIGFNGGERLESNDDAYQSSDITYKNMKSK